MSGKCLLNRVRGAANQDSRNGTPTKFRDNMTTDKPCGAGYGNSHRLNPGFAPISMAFPPLPERPRRILPSAADAPRREETILLPAQARGCRAWGPAHLVRPRRSAGRPPLRDTRLRSYRSGAWNPWAKPSGTTMVLWFSALSTSAYHCRKVGEPWRKSTATSNTSPSKQLTNFVSA